MDSFLKKQIIKTASDIVNTCDLAIAIQEAIMENEKVIEKTDEAKDLIEEKTGYHIKRSYESDATYVDTSTDSYRETYELCKGRSEEYDKDYEAYIKEEQEKESRDSTIAVTLAICTIGLIIFILKTF